MDIMNDRELGIPRRPSGFTLIELIFVIVIIGILLTLLFPAFRALEDQAKKTQAKNDLMQIVTAVNGFYAEYGVYPIDTTGGTIEKTFGPGGNPATNETLLTELRGCTAASGSCPGAAVINSRQIAFLSPPDVKDAGTPRSGIGTSATTKGQFFDPWGRNYVVRVDGDYSGDVQNPYSSGAGANPIRQGVIVWSLGSDGSQSTPNFTGSDDVISWQ
jgi:prepilin-type N-terminal cleavage/methylation domain-containing protein